MNVKGGTPSYRVCLLEHKKDRLNVLRGAASKRNEHVPINGSLKGEVRGDDDTRQILKK